MWENILYLHRIGFKWFFQAKESTKRNNRPEVFLGKGILKLYSKFTGKHPCPSVISIKWHLGMGVFR